MFKRLTHGIILVLGILLREMENILNGLVEICCFYNDVVISSKYESEIMKGLFKVL